MWILKQIFATISVNEYEKLDQVKVYKLTDVAVNLQGSIDGASLAEKIREKRRENAMLATPNYGPFSYQINDKQNSAEIVKIRQTMTFISS